MVTKTEPSALIEFPLEGPGGEPVDLRRTLASHGVASLPPMQLDESAWMLEVTLPAGRSARTVRIRANGRAKAVVEVTGRAPGRAASEELASAARTILNLDQDLSPFYEIARDDPALSWAASGAGRMIRTPTVFESVIKTVCTTNCAWAGTERMVSALVEHLGAKAPGAPATGHAGRAFPTPEAMAEMPERFYRDVVRAGYRAPYLRAIARGIANGSMEIESWAYDDMDDDELAFNLLALPGIGPYAAAHVMMMLGRHSRLILDSWTRPKYARLVGRKVVKDATIERRFRRYGEYAGLAFWLFLTRDWISDDA
jgi:3-methyladenine DNA glycosylase/8-oxoguanine DNA glycosylase